MMARASIRSSAEAQRSGNFALAGTASSNASVPHPDFQSNVSQSRIVAIP